MTKPKRRPTPSQRLSNLQALINICIRLIDEDDIKEVSNRTQLSVATLYRIQSDKLTLKIHVETLQKVATAAGLNVVLGEQSSFHMLEER